ncbi:hypothetical protein H7F33_10155 [Pedobacter sp. PAMC26386]|nr:hypothetical protein H7F33_10155 [Pedobacter sp. PAMC26386]
MAVLRKGLNDGYVGKIGNTVTYELNGEMVKRTIGIYDDPKTIPQLSVRQVTSVTSAFLIPVHDFITIGFDLEAKKTRKGAYNIASSYNRLNAITGKYPNQNIDFTKVLFSRGKMPIIPKPSVTLTKNKLAFTWDTDFTANGIKPTDRVMLIAYLPERHRAVCLISGAKRTAGVEYLSIPRSKKPMIIETYISFISETHKSISTSLYVGQVLSQIE